MKPVISTFTRKLIDPTDPRVIDIFDIAHSLACLNRFNGHACRPISVAQHSVYVSRVAVAMYSNYCTKCGVAPDPLRLRQIQAQGLLHDASEAYLGDITKWLKASPAFEEYRRIEAKVQGLIFDHFFGTRNATTLSPFVEEADRLMVRFEFGRGYGPTMRIPHDKYPPVAENSYERSLIGHWRFLSWTMAKELFLAEARLIGLAPKDRIRP